MSFQYFNYVALHLTLRLLSWGPCAAHAHLQEGVGDGRAERSVQGRVQLPGAVDGDLGAGVAALQRPAQVPGPGGGVLTEHQSHRRTLGRRSWINSCISAQQ